MIESMIEMEIPALGEDNKLSRSSFHRSKIAGCVVDAADFEECLNFIEERLCKRKQVKVGCLNAAKLVAAQKDERLKHALEECELVLADGMAIVWAARGLGIPLKQRVAGIDMMLALLQCAQHDGYRVFLLGAHDTVLRLAVENIQRLYSGINIVGFQHGYYLPDELPAIIKRINDVGTQMLFVALGTPQKEIWIAEHADQLNANLIMGVGGSVDVIAGVRKRAPRWMQHIGLEWFWRLLLEPRRMGKRYLVGNVLFALIVLKEMIRRMKGGMQEEYGEQR